LGRNGEIPRLLLRLIADQKEIDPANAVTLADEVLKVAMGEPRRLLDAADDFAGVVRVIHQRGDAKQRGRDIGGRIGWNLLGIDGDIESAVLQEARGGEADRATADHGSLA